MKPSLFFVALTLLFTSSCENLKDCCAFPGGGRVEFRQLEKVEMEEGSCLISGYRLTNKEFIHYEDIVSYDDETFEFEIRGESQSRVAGITKGTPFALVVGGEVVYTGHFWPAFLSLLCEGITIDPLSLQSSEVMRVQFFEFNERPLPDRRNHEFLLSTLREDGKLK